jgi:small ligand-binding sensory domain FIST
MRSTRPSRPCAIGSTSPSCSYRRRSRKSKGDLILELDGAPPLQVGDVAVGGFFCNGEIDPVGGTTFLHAYTSSFALFRHRT